MSTLQRRYRTKIRMPFLACLATGFFCSPLSYATNSFDCDAANCNLRSTDTYPHIVIGRAIAVATDDQAREVYRWAKSHGYWKGLPDDEDQFVKLVQVMSIAIPSNKEPQELTLLMAREEYDSRPIHPGEYVRYTPHTVDEPQTPLFAEPIAKKYWDLFGCIAVLCDAENTQCPDQFVGGTYRFGDGVQLDDQSGSPLKNGVHINTQTYLPLPESTASQP